MSFLWPFHYNFWISLIDCRVHSRNSSTKISFGLALSQHKAAWCPFLTGLKQYNLKRGANKYHLKLCLLVSRLKTTQQNQISLNKTRSSELWVDNEVNSRIVRVLSRKQNPKRLSLSIYKYTTNGSESLYFYREIDSTYPVFYAA